jgi:hypothetical protein
VAGFLVTATLLPTLAFPLADRLGATIAIWVLGLVAWAIFVAALAVVAIVPPLLLGRRDHAAFAAHSWIGAREVRRVVGRASRAIGLPTDAKSANEWLVRTPASDRNRVVRVDAFLMAGRFDEARSEAALLSERTPLEAYRKQEAQALVDDQTGSEVDEDALRAAVEAVPRGIDRTEAAVSLAVFRARRALPDGNWRAPLVEARAAIPGSDLQVLVADFSLPIFEILVRRIAVPFAAVIALIAASVTVLPAILR